MKEKIHPIYEEIDVRCACGNVIKTKSTGKDITVEVCSKCHPFFTGNQKFVDSRGRIEKFKQRVAGANSNEK